MLYGQFQYYSDELSGWSRVIAMHKESLRESVRQLSVILLQSLLPSANTGDSNTAAPGISEKESNAFTDQLMVHEQQFDHIAHQIISQRQRLERTSLYPGSPVECPVCQQQDSLRIKMQNTERNFIRIKYTCSIFLSSFLGSKSALVAHRKHPAKPYVQV
jgi:hypothetical protein